MAEKRERWELELEEMLKIRGVSSEESGGASGANPGIFEISTDSETIEDILNYLQAAIGSAMKNRAEKTEFALGENLSEAIASNPHIILNLCLKTGLANAYDADEKKLIVWH